MYTPQTHTHTHTHMRVHAHTPTHPHIHTPHVHAHMYTHTCVHAHTYTPHTCVCAHTHTHPPHTHTPHTHTPIFQRSINHMLTFSFGDKKRTHTYKPYLPEYKRRFISVLSKLSRLMSTYSANTVWPVYSCLSNLFETIKFETALCSVL